MRSEGASNRKENIMKEKMQTALNDQIREELNSAYIYFAIAADFEAKDLSGFAHWMEKQAAEEMEHAMRIYGYLNKRGARATMKAIDAPQASWDTPLEAFQTAFKHERYISGCIDKLVKTAREVEDTATESFLTWFVDEQVEEESTADQIVKKLEMVASSPQGLYMMDRELGQRG
jgi:ferritin